MIRELLTFETEAEWLAMREKDLTSTEAPALFGLSPYDTLYGLYHRKTGQLEAEFEANDRMKWGNRLEAAIAYGIAEDLGLVVEPFKVYARIADLRMGSSFDYKIIGLAEGYKGDDETYRELFRENGPGIMEVKNVDGLAFRRTWINDGQITEAPAHIELQVQHQQEVADLEWTCIAPLIGGNTPMPFARMRDRQIGQAIIDKCGEFWQMVDTGKAPAPDFKVAEDNGETVDMTKNARLAECVKLHADASARFKTAEEEKKASKAEILHIVQNNRKILVDGGYINANTVKDSPGTLIEAHHIGTRVGGRSGYRAMRFYPKSK
jgi:putative phage-type endonuclease